MTADGQELVSKVAAGEHDALMAALQAHGPGVRARLKISPRWQSDLTIDDVMQEAYIRALRSIGTFESRGEDAFAKWLYTLARRSLLDAIKGLMADKRGEKFRRVSVPDGEEAWVELFGVVTETPSREAAGGEALRHLKAALMLLSELDRKAIVMSFVEGKTPKQVADSLGCTKGAFHMRKARALLTLHELLGATSKYF
jgi:RNA polymerase sigma-70 factor (ECF subfamily)